MTLSEYNATLCASQVWIVYGDGSLGYSVAEFDTFTRHKVKSLIYSHYIFISNSLNHDKCAILEELFHFRMKSNKSEMHLKYL